MKKGTFYGIGVGPGDPELLTLKAVLVMKRCRVIAAPKTAGENMTALEIAKASVDLSDKVILPLPFLMTSDLKKAEEGHRSAAEAVLAYLREGQDVAMLTLGDVSVYSTYGYLAEYVEAEGYPIEMIPGVTSFCAAAAALKISLTRKDKPVHIIPVGYGNPEETLRLAGTHVLMKAGRKLPEVREMLSHMGLNEQAGMVVNCGLPGEKVYGSIDEAGDENGYFATIIVRK
ncbi:precorrin-2 C(20)-methyltransferase [Anaerolentibacter hominis]|uniref:precorrin-2 C(20)-methyltransferase n=1 Tax=Anaerolentibacter hominis TaxID=3079009 RepID=UPI0031B85427